MMTLDEKRKRVELYRLKASREELELKILEREAEIEKIKENMAMQDVRIAELHNQLTQGA